MSTPHEATTAELQRSIGRVEESFTFRQAGADNVEAGVVDFPQTPDVAEEANENVRDVSHNPKSRKKNSTGKATTAANTRTPDGTIRKSPATRPRCQITVPDSVEENRQAEELLRTPAPLQQSPTLNNTASLPPRHGGPRKPASPKALKLVAVRTDNTSNVVRTNSPQDLTKSLDTFLSQLPQDHQEEYLRKKALVSIFCSSK